MKTIELTQGKEAIVDDEDYERLSKFNWCAVSIGRNFMASRWAKVSLENGNVYMHSDIAGNINGLHLDHINGNGLDNRSENLRWALPKENIRNSRKQQNTSSQYKGVTWDRGKWKAAICVDGKRMHLGRFSSEQDAAKAYNEASKKYFGEFARGNVL